MVERPSDGMLSIAGPRLPWLRGTAPGSGQRLGDTDTRTLLTCRPPGHPGSLALRTTSSVPRPAWNSQRSSGAASEGVARLGEWAGVVSPTFGRRLERLSALLGSGLRLPFEEGAALRGAFFGAPSSRLCTGVCGEGVAVESVSGEGTGRVSSTDPERFAQH